MRSFPLSRMIAGSGCFRRFFSSSAGELIITPRCADHIRKLGDGSFLRVAVDVGGCGGFQYRFDVDKELDSEDVVFEKDGSKVVTDAVSLEYLNGAIVDYQVSMMRSGYSIIDNPLADASCGCGVSFSPKS